MKKAIFIAAFLVFNFLTSNAQTEKHTSLSGDIVSYTTTRVSNTSLIIPNTEIVAWKNVALGASIKIKKKFIGVVVSEGVFK
jgi:hypothetical protein